jgi:hypothetical protein
LYQFRDQMMGQQQDGIVVERPLMIKAADVE